LGECGPCPRLGELCPGICLTTEEKARKNLSQGLVQDGTQEPNGIWDQINDAGTGALYL